MTFNEAVETVKKNWPDERYTMLAEALTVLINHPDEIRRKCKSNTDRLEKLNYKPCDKLDEADDRYWCEERGCECFVDKDHRCEQWSNVVMVPGGAVEAIKAECAGECRWSEVNEGDDTLWSTSCGGEWYFTEGSPKDGGYMYCPRCGRHVVFFEAEEAGEP